MHLKNDLKLVKITGGGRNVEFQNVDRPKISERRNGLFSRSERRKSKRSERRKCPSIFHKSDQNVENKKTSTTYGVLPMVTKACGGLG